MLITTTSSTEYYYYVREACVRSMDYLRCGKREGVCVCVCVCVSVSLSRYMHKGRRVFRKMHFPGPVGMMRFPFGVSSREKNRMSRGGRTAP